MSKKPAVSRPSAFFGALPILAFSLVICLLVICFYQAAHTSLPPTEKRYMTAKAGISTLKNDQKRNMQREPWEKLAAEFQSIYKGDPDWPNRPAALLRAAEVLEELASRSCSRSDARKAIACYESLALRHSQSRLADDALYHAARLRAAMLKDEKGALALISRVKKQYPNGDMLAQAIALEKAIRASREGKTAPEALKNYASPSASIPEELAQPTFVDKKRNFSGDIPLRFQAAKTRMAKLRNDGSRSCWRQPWEDLREEFLRIRRQAKSAIAPQALFHAAESQLALAQCSRLGADKRKAIELYSQFIKDYPRHALADNALLACARAEYSLSGQQSLKNALASLNKIVSQYPKSDAAPDARKLISLWSTMPATAAAVKSAAKNGRSAMPELQVLSWDSINKNNVEIVLEMSAPAAYVTRLEKAAPGKPARLTLDLKNAGVVKDIRKGVMVNGSLLKAIRVQPLKEGGNRLQFDFRDVKHYEAQLKKNPDRIVLNIAAVAPKGKPKSAGTSVAGKTGSRLGATQVSDLASQLGLTVKRVFIDAGHGGKDPGTSHNGIVEKDITLDIALSLGKLLEANGMEVIYSRASNKGVPLSERARMANAAHADLFVSIHVNANDNPNASGVETYYLDLATNRQAARVAMLENAASDKRLGDMQSMLAEVMLRARANESKWLASDIQRLAVARLNKRDFPVRGNGVKSAPFHVLIGARMPAVLVEVGYCSNAVEARNLATVKYRQALSVGLAEGIAAYRDRLLRNRTADKALTGKKSGAI